MISVRRAFTGLTTTPVLYQVLKAGSYNIDNEWVAGDFTNPVTIHVTPLPYGNREDGILGDQLVPLASGERIPSYMQIHSSDEIPVNSYLTMDEGTYKIIRKGSYKAAGYWATLGERVNDKWTHPDYVLTDKGILPLEVI